MRQIEVITGIRPTGNLTIANYLGAVVPILELQRQGRSPLVFVADIHAMTDHEPREARKQIKEVVADYLALGIDPKITKVYVQSSIIGEVTTMMALLARHISVAELLRVPTLKDKLRDNQRPETANSLLLLYPVLMAADILLNRAKSVPVGEDQLAHMEVARKLARRFNKEYGNVFPEPVAMQLKSLRILSLRGEGKMSKTNPDGAIFLTDTMKEATRKIKLAETAFEGKMTDRLESHIQMARGLAVTASDEEEIDVIIRDHMSGKPVMGKFKQLLTRLVVRFLEEFQNAREEITKNPELIPSVLKDGARVAKANADTTLEKVYEAIYKSSG